MKRIIAVFLSVILITGTIPLITLATSSKSIDLLFNENIDYTSDGDFADAGDTYEKNSKIIENKN